MSFLPAATDLLRRTIDAIRPAFCPFSSCSTEAQPAGMQHIHPYLLPRVDAHNSDGNGIAVFAHRGLASVVLTLATDGIDGIGPEAPGGATSPSPSPSPSSLPSETSPAPGDLVAQANLDAPHSADLAASRSLPSGPSLPSLPAVPYLHGRPGAEPRIPTPSGVIVENTRAAFRAAEQIGVDYIETDCRLDGDGRVVLVHDPTLRRILGDERRVRDLPTTELATALQPVGGLITVDEALREFPTLRFNIDCKTREAAAPLGRIVATHGERVLVTSFDDGTRRDVLAAAQHAAPGMIRPATSPGKNSLIFIILAVALGFSPLINLAVRGVDCLQIPERQGRIQVLTPRLLRAAHSRGIHIHVWTVNDPANMRRLAAMGVDGIISDRADLAVEVYRPSSAGVV